jgi:hypothetical protein
MRAPLQTRFGGWKSVAFNLVVVLAAVAVTALANAAPRCTTCTST